MAREPIALQQQPIPFSESVPADELQVEEFGDDVLIGDPSLDDVDEPDNNFYANLAEEMSEKELSSKASELISYYDNDREARSEWEER